MKSILFTALLLSHLSTPSARAADPVVTEQPTYSDSHELSHEALDESRDPASGPAGSVNELSKKPTKPCEGACN